MTYRNWKQELEDRRPTPRGRRKVWLLAAAAVLLAAAVLCMLWWWPGWLRDADAPDDRPSAEDLYLSAAPQVHSSGVQQTGAEA